MKIPIKMVPARPNSAKVCSVLLSIVLSISLTSFSSSLIAEDITENSFVGTWCGKWDNIFETCLTINSIEKNSVAKYRWLEHPNGKFKKNEKKIARVNRNTLKIDNIWFVLDENNLNQANVMGVFRVQTRITVLRKNTN